jgi:error-prone DNA polymerase
VNDLARRAQLNRGDLESLAAADALASLAGHRHKARWHTSGVEPDYPVFGHAGIREGTPLISKPTLGESVVADYASVGLSLKAHPVALIRQQLDQLGIQSASVIQTSPSGQQTYIAGLVITRQRPASANNVAFLTLEDETGHLNVVVWRTIAERQRSVLTGAKLMGVIGEIQREGEVLHIIAQQLQDLSALLNDLTVRSRDFR